MKKQKIFSVQKSLPLLFLSLFLFNFCTEPDFIGLEVQPESDLFNVIYLEDIPITARTVKEDSIRSSRTIYNLLGSYSDPVFGDVSASFYTHVRLSSNEVDFGPNAVADSLVLSLVYDDYYGEIQNIQVEVHEVVEAFHRDSNYYSNAHFATASNLLASQSISPNPDDSVSVGGQMQPPQMRIQLNAALAQRFIDASGTTDLSNNDAFIEFFKGIYVKTLPVNSDGAIFYFDLLNTLSRMTLYYSNDNNDSLSFNFVINDNCARVTNFEHDSYTDNVLQSQLDGDTISSDSILYLQGMGSTKIFLSIPTSTLLEENIKAINKVELIIPVEIDDPTKDKYPPPDRLALVRITESGELAFILDQFEGDSHFRGMYDEDKKAYTFTITRHIQNILNETIQDYGMYLMVSGAAVNAGRVLIRGHKNTKSNLKVKITYIKI